MHLLKSDRLPVHPDKFSAESDKLSSKPDGFSVDLKKRKDQSIVNPIKMLS